MNLCLTGQMEFERSLHTFWHVVSKMEFMYKSVDLWTFVCQWTPRTGAQRNLVATYACNDHYDESSLGYQLTLISPAYCYQMSLPLLSSVDGEENFRVSFLVFFHIISHSYIILPKYRASYYLLKSPCKILNNQNSTQIRLNVPSQVCLWNH